MTWKFQPLRKNIRNIDMLNVTEFLILFEKLLRDCKLASEYTHKKNELRHSREAPHLTT